MTRHPPPPPRGVVRAELAVSGGWVDSLGGGAERGGVPSVTERVVGCDPPPTPTAARERVEYEEGGRAGAGEVETERECEGGRVRGSCWDL